GAIRQKRATPCKEFAVARPIGRSPRPRAATRLEIPRRWRVSSQNWSTFMVKIWLASVQRITADKNPADLWTQKLNEQHHSDEQAHATLNDFAGRTLRRRQRAAQGARPCATRRVAGGLFRRWGLRFARKS